MSLWPTARTLVSANPEKRLLGEGVLEQLWEAGTGWALAISRVRSGDGFKRGREVVACTVGCHQPPATNYRMSGRGGQEDGRTRSWTSGRTSSPFYLVDRRSRVGRFYEKDPDPFMGAVLAEETRPERNEGIRDVVNRRKTRRGSRGWGGRVR